MHTYLPPACTRTLLVSSVSAELALTCFSPECPYHFGSSLYDEERAPFWDIYDRRCWRLLGRGAFKTHSGKEGSTKFAQSFLRGRVVDGPGQEIITSVVCDGGPSEQAAIPILQQELLPNVTLVTRDRAHRTRSMMKGIFNTLNDLCSGLLGIFTTDDQSLARMLKTPGLWLSTFDWVLVFWLCIFLGLHLSPQPAHEVKDIYQVPRHLPSRAVGTGPEIWQSFEKL